MYYRTKIEKAKDLKKLFLKIIRELSLTNYDDFTVDEIISRRDFSEFSSVWEELSDDRPNLNEDDDKIVKLLCEEVYNNIPKGIHHELSNMVVSDFELILTYLISGEHNPYLSCLFWCYCIKVIPEHPLEKFDKTLEELLLQNNNWGSFRYN
jgi:hypothetical protein